MPRFCDTVIIREDSTSQQPFGRAPTYYVYFNFNYFMSHFTQASL